MKRNYNKRKTIIHINKTTKRQLYQLKQNNESLDYIIQGLMKYIPPEKPFKLSKSTQNFIFQLKFKHHIDESKLLYIMIKYFKDNPKKLNDLIGNHKKYK